MWTLYIYIQISCTYHSSTRHLEHCTLIWLVLQQRASTSAVPTRHELRQCCKLLVATNLQIEGINFQHTGGVQALAFSSLSFMLQRGVWALFWPKWMSSLHSAKHKIWSETTCPINALATRRRHALQGSLQLKASCDNQTQWCESDLTIASLNDPYRAIINLLSSKSFGCCPLSR